MAAFSTALYYPWMDIPDEGWIKNALLYWDTIQTIVPESVRQPYESRIARELQDEGLLQPLFVESRMVEIESLTADVLIYMESKEGRDLLASTESNQRFLLRDKLPNEIKRLVRLHPQKMSNELRHLADRFSFRRDGDWLHVDQRFGNFYMTLLATRLSQILGLGLLTDSAPSDRLANASRLGAQYSILNLRDPEFGHYGRRHFGIENQPRQLAEGALAELILKGVDINPQTSVRKILEFRKSYSDELGFLRTKVAELTKTFEDDQPLDALIQRVNDVYANEFVPQLNAFKKALTASKIKWAAENLLKVSFFSTASTSVPLALLGLSVPYALLVGAGVSLTVAATLYNHERVEKLSTSPFSYVMAAEKKLRR